jgi:hypothetical protein
MKFTAKGLPQIADLAMDYKLVGEGSVIPVRELKNFFELSCESNITHRITGATVKPYLVM